MRDSAGQAVNAEVTIATVPPLAEGLIWGPVLVNMLSGRDIRELIRDCEKRVPADVMDWGEVMLQAFQAAVRHWRASSAPLSLCEVTPQPKRWLVPGFAAMGETTMIVADASSGKSYFGMGLALATAAGVPFIPGVVEPAVQCPVLYLDWEDEGEEQVRRVRRLMPGLGLSGIPDGLIYQPMTRPLSECVQPLSQLIAERGVGLVIIDSTGYATSGEAEKSGSAQVFTQACRRLRPAARIALAHISKADRDKKATSGRSSYGSVFYFAGIRAEWQIVSASDEGSSITRLSFHHSKGNNFMKQASFAVAMEFDDSGGFEDPGPVTYRQIELSEDLELAEHARLPVRIIALLRSERTPMTTDDIARDLDTKTTVVRVTCNRLKARNILTALSRNGRGTVWGLCERVYEVDMAGNYV